MNALPAIVLAALSICAKHISVWTDTWGPLTTQSTSCAKTATCGELISSAGFPTQWETPYGECRTIYARASEIQVEIANRKSNARLAKKLETERRKAAKDLAVMKAALKVMGK